MIRTVKQVFLHHIISLTTFLAYSYRLCVFTEPFKTLLMKTPLQGAQTSIYLASDSQKSKVSGKYFE